MITNTRSALCINQSIFFNFRKSFQQKSVALIILSKRIGQMDLTVHTVIQKTRRSLKVASCFNVTIRNAGSKHPSLSVQYLKRQEQAW